MHEKLSEKGQSLLQKGKKEKGEKGKAKNNNNKKILKPNLERRKSLSCLKILISTHARAKMS